MRGAMSERRHYYRLNIEEFDLKLLVIPGDENLYVGKIRDISSGGISFYSDKDSFVINAEKVIDIIFNVEDDNGEKTFILKLEIIREENRGEKTLHAGRFIGVSNDLKDKLFQTLEKIARKQPVLV